MTAVEWTEEPLTRSHDRGGFACGDKDLDLYLQRNAR